MRLRKPAVRKFKTELKRVIMIVSLAIIFVFLVLFYFLVAFLGVGILEKQNRLSNEAVNTALSDQLEVYEEYIVNEFEKKYVQKIERIETYQQSLYIDLYQFVDRQRIKSIFHVIDPNGHVLMTSSYTKNQIDSDSIFLSGIYRQMKRNPHQTMMQLNKVQLSNRAHTLFSIGKALILNDQIIGYLVFDLLEQDLNELIQKNPVDLLVITDEFQNAILSTDTTVLNNIGKFEPVIENNKYTYSIRNQKHYVMETYTKGNQLRVYTLTSHQFLNSLYLAGFITQVLILLVSIYGINKMANHFTKKNTKSIDQLLHAIEEVRKGNLHAELSIDSFEEFSQVSTYFNEMTDNLVSLIKENSELLIRNNISEIRQLEAQFNPHFLFNSLESLKYLIRFRSDNAESFVIKLAGILRYSIQNSEDYVPLSKEIKYIKDYLDIQKIRYNKRLHYNIEIASDCEEAVIPKLIIQPIIENCLHHGYREDQLILTVKSLRAGDHLHLIVEDNGNGFSPQRLQEVNDMLDSEANDSDHIGLYNVHRRLVLQYGKSFGVFVNSIYQQRTTVTLVLPFTKREEKES